MPTVLVTPAPPKSRGGLREESVGVLTGVVEVAIELILPRLWKRWAAAEGPGGEVCSKEKGVIAGLFLSGSMPPKTGVKVGVERPGGGRAAVVAEMLEGKETPASLLGGDLQLGFDVGSAEAAAGGAEAERW